MHTEILFYIHKKIHAIPLPHFSNPHQDTTQYIWEQFQSVFGPLTPGNITFMQERKAELTLIQNIYKDQIQNDYF